MFPQYILVASVLQGFSIGVTRVTAPVAVVQAYSIFEEETGLALLTLGFEPLSGLKLQGGYGFRSMEEEEEHYMTEEVVDSRALVFEAGAWYTVYRSGSAGVSAGIRYMRSSTKVESNSDPVSLKTVQDSIGPSARIDFSIPGLDDVFLYSQVGVDYRKLESTYYSFGEEDQVGEREEWATTAPEYILSGLYFSF